MTDDEYARALEYTQQDYSFVWQGQAERVWDLGEALVRVYGTVGLALRLAIPADRVEERLTALVAQVERGAGDCF